MTPVLDKISRYRHTVEISEIKANHEHFDCGAAGFKNSEEYYNIEGSVGSRVAQQLQKGDKIRIGINGIVQSNDFRVSCHIASFVYYIVYICFLSCKITSEHKLLYNVHSHETAVAR